MGASLSQDHAGRYALGSPRVKPGGDATPSGSAVASNWGQVLNRALPEQGTIQDLTPSHSDPLDSGRAARKAP